MINSIITELARVETLATTTNEEFLAKAKLINSFLKQQDGFIDSELIKSLEGNTWYFIFHIENISKLKAVAEILKSNKLFDQITPLITAGSMNFSFFNQIEKW